MPTIHLTTFIAAASDVVFDISRHIGLHKESMEKYKEQAVAGTTIGLIEKGDTVTWKAKHFFKTRTIMSKITEMEKHSFFVVEQARGDFKSLRHEHHFKPCDNGTIMIDVFEFETPYGAVGHLINSFYLTNYIKKLLEHRNAFLKKFAEGERWKALLGR
jgi:ligand-binding SRPBCC domain-containing protein